MNYEFAWRYALKRLENELPNHLYYHGVFHTKDVVVPALDRLCRAYELTPDERLLVLTAGWYHDIGYIEQYDRNEPVGVRIASDMLWRFGYTAAEIDLVADLIMATQMPHNPQNLLHEIMADADLDALGREDFIESASSLRKELAVWKGIRMADVTWYNHEMTFLKKHHYFTHAQRHYRNGQKLKNYMRLARMLIRERALAEKYERHKIDSDETIPYQIFE